MSYDRSSVQDKAASGWRVDDNVVVIGHGPGDFERARRALLTWQQFDIGWARVFPAGAPVAAGTVVAVLIRHLGFWSLSGCRVLEVIDSPGDRFGFVYGTLTNHAVRGEERFEVFVEPGGSVVYHIRAVSQPRAAVARVGAPIAARIQARFRRDSSDAMKRAAGRG